MNTASNVVSNVLIGFASGLASRQATHMTSEAARRELQSLLGRPDDTIGDGTALAQRLMERLGGLEQRVAHDPDADDVTPITELSRELLVRAERLEAPDREQLRRVGQALQGSSRVLASISRADAERLMPATRWLSPDGRFQAWTERPWSQALSPQTPWGRFLLLTLAACWEFPEPFEEATGFVLWLADTYPSADGQLPAGLRERLAAYRAAAGKASAGMGGLNSGRMSALQGRAAAEAELIGPKELRVIARYARLAARLELPEGQHRLPVSLIAELNIGAPLSLAAILGRPEWNMIARLEGEAQVQPILSLDFLMAAAALEEAFDALDAVLGPETTLEPEAVARLVTRLRDVKARFITRGGAKVCVLRAQLPFVLRELRCRGRVVDPALCCVADVHARRSLQRLFPTFFSGPAAAFTPEGTRWVEARCAERWGEAVVSALREAPLADTYHEAFLLSALTYMAAPAEECLYEVPLCYMDIVGHSPAELPPSLSLPAVVARKSLARGLKRLEERLMREPGGRERLQQALDDAQLLIRQGARSRGRGWWWR